MLCSLSGEIAREPVLSTKSGRIFEKVLLAKHLSRDPRDPVTNEPMTMEDDTIAVKTTNEIVQPRPNANSLPGMIQAFQDEWDALMLEAYSLKQSLHSTRKELTQALYRYDAATRVIARLQAERDEARTQLSQMQTSAPAVQEGQTESAMEIEPTAERGESSQLSADVIDSIKKNCDNLSSKRRSAFKNPTPTLASKEQIAEYQQQTQLTLHLTTKPGITCVDAHQTNNDFMVTAGKDGRVIIIDLETERAKSTLKGHDGPINSVAFHKERLLVASASDDSTVRLWSGSDASSFKLASEFSDHDDAVTSLSMHSSGKYFGAASKDKAWSLYDIDSENLIHKYEDESITSGYSCGAFHPDGVLFAAGSGDNIVVWDCLASRPVQVFEGHAGQLTSISFSENGYYMASADSNGIAKIFDLRKVQAVHEFPKRDSINAVRFNSTGHYLAVASDVVQVYEVVKQWPLITTLENQCKKPQPFTDVVFGADAAFVATVSLDRHLTVYSKPSG